MSESQLSFLSTEPSLFDVNAIDDGVILPAPVIEGLVGSVLARRSVDDCVLGLGFTNWKSLIDHALRTGHFELYDSENGLLGLRMYGHRYAPIPRLPAAGATYVQQRLLAVAAERKLSPGRNERMITPSAGVAHKCAIEGGLCDLTIKQHDGLVVRAAIPIDQLSFSDTHKNDPVQLGKQLERVLIQAGAYEDEPLRIGAKSLAAYILRVVQGVR